MRKVNKKKAVLKHYWHSVFDTAKLLYLAHSLSLYRRSRQKKKQTHSLSELFGFGNIWSSTTKSLTGLGRVTTIIKSIIFNFDSIRYFASRRERGHQNRNEFARKVHISRKDLLFVFRRTSFKCVCVSLYLSISLTHTVCVYCIRSHLCNEQNVSLLMLVLVCFFFCCYNSQLSILVNLIHSKRNNSVEHM